MISNSEMRNTVLENGLLSVRNIYEYLEGMKYFNPDRLFIEYKRYNAKERKYEMVEYKVIFTKEDKIEIENLKILRDLLNTLDFDKINKRLIADNI